MQQPRQPRSGKGGNRFPESMAEPISSDAANEGTKDAIPSADQIRITTSLKSQKGSVWTKTKSVFEHWEVEVTFRVTGRGRIGADGLAIWFTEEQGLEGPVFGAADKWNGVGIFFDSFDNDGKKNNPGVIVVGNNGKLQYDHQKITEWVGLEKPSEIIESNPWSNPTVITSPGHGVPWAADDAFETVSDRELRQIFEGQNRIHLEIKQLNRQLDMILDEQRRYVAAVTEEVAKRGAASPAQQGQVSQQEVETVVKNQEEVLRQVNEIRNSVADALRSFSAAQPAGSAGVYETTQHFNDIKEHLHLVKRDLEHLAQRNVPSSDKPKCPELPPLPSCLSTMHFIMFVAVQTVLFIGYIMYRSQQEAAAKKFF
ncbi:Protein ERGIC-53 [Willisornis vidua]|uniref:Protein ERGIC-53 n=1 Tax=Willisornis vidua TaxID=1566151 RepID=A0ABQ9DK70_9PASS|nr:Protein ERGIC-53 [Willisornis vidua]